MSQHPTRTGRSRPHVKYAPRETFEQILEYCVIPTFDLLIEVPPDHSIILVRRIIAPYENKWALPGLRMLKPEGIEDVLTRIAEDEVGLPIDVASRRYIGQYVGRFTTEHERQDISTGYAVRALHSQITLNREHFSSYRMINGRTGIPDNIGAMYRYYLETYFARAVRD